LIPTENPRDNIILRTWVHNNVTTRIFAKYDLTGKTPRCAAITSEKNELFS
jgi:hypothetical protein